MDTQDAYQEAWQIFVAENIDNIMAIPNVPLLQKTFAAGRESNMNEVIEFVEKLSIQWKNNLTDEHLHVGADQILTELKYSLIPECPKCGSKDKMIKHSDGEWVCHNTHRVEDDA
jgi:ribosomal protein S27AE